MKYSRGLVLALFTLCACSDNPTSPEADARARAIAGPSLAALVTTSNDVVPVNISAFVPCANGGAGETVDVSGNLHQTFGLVISESGNVTVKSHFQPQGISGVGQVTGDTYHATGVTSSVDNTRAPFPIVSRFVNNFRFIGTGPDNNLLIHEVGHLTIDANGVVRVDVDKLSVECR